MGLRIYTFSLILATASALAVDTPPGVEAPPLGVMRRAPLQDLAPYVVGVGALPTTILMPSPIEAFQGEGLTRDNTQVANCFIEHTSGTRFFSVKALLPGVADLNVLCDGRLYSFRFITTDKPTRTLTILPPDQFDSGQRKAIRSISPERLLKLLNDAKSYFAVKAQHPDLGRQIEVVAPGSVQTYRDYRIIVDQVFRFDRDDTLVFRVIFINDSYRPLNYNPAEAGIRIGQNIYWASFADLSGLIPAAKPAFLAWEPATADVKAEISEPGQKLTDISTFRKVGLEFTGPHSLTLSKQGEKPQVFPFTVDTARNPTSPAVSQFEIKKPESSLLKSALLQQPQTGQSFGYIVITGKPDGSRAEISLENNFQVILPIGEPK